MFVLFSHGVAPVSRSLHDHHFSTRQSSLSSKDVLLGTWSDARQPAVGNWREGDTLRNVHHFGIPAELNLLDGQNVLLTQACDARADDGGGDVSNVLWIQVVDHHVYPIFVPPFAFDRAARHDLQWSTAFPLASTLRVARSCLRRCGAMVLHDSMSSW